MTTPRTTTKTTTRKAATAETTSSTRNLRIRAGNRTGNGASKRKPTFDIDAELLDKTYNQVRRPQLPYGIVVNDKPAGILLPLDQLDKAGWLETPNKEELSNITFGENEVTGLFIGEARRLILAFVPEYIRYKADVEAVGSTVVEPYEEYRPNLDKKTMDVCAEHALVFLDDDNQPLHTRRHYLLCQRRVAPKRLLRSWSQSATCVMPSRLVTRIWMRMRILSIRRQKPWTTRIWNWRMTLTMTSTWMMRTRRSRG